MIQCDTGFGATTKHDNVKQEKTCLVVTTEAVTFASGRGTHYKVGFPQ